MEFGDDFVIVDPFDIDMTYYEGQRSLTALNILFPGFSQCLQVEETGREAGAFYILFYDDGCSHDHHAIVGIALVVVFIVAICFILRQDQAALKDCNRSVLRTATQ